MLCFKNTYADFDAKPLKFRWKKFREVECENSEFNSLYTVRLVMKKTVRRSKPQLSVHMEDTVSATSTTLRGARATAVFMIENVVNYIGLSTRFVHFSKHSRKKATKKILKTKKR